MSSIIGLDKIICINLINRKDKYDRVKHIFKNLNLNVEFYQPEKHTYSGRIGCFESHINVITNCYNNNLNNVLIFEDDIINTSSYNNDTIVKAVEYLNHHKDWEYLQLGYTILPHEIIDFFISKKINDNIIKYNGNCAHAYIVNRNGMKRILKNWKEYCYDKKNDLDIYYKYIFTNTGLSYCPILFEQDFCIDNDNEIATTTYYKFIRSFSCIQYNYSCMYYLSVIKLYIFYIIIFFCFILFIIIYLYNNYFYSFIITLTKRKIRTLLNPYNSLWKM